MGRVCREVAIGYAGEKLGGFVGGRGAKRNLLAAVLCSGVLLAACAAPAPTGSSTGSVSDTSTSSAAETATSAEATGNAQSSIGLSLPAEVTETMPSAPAGSIGGTTAPPLPDCAGGALPTLTAGTLTIGTGTPTQTPWFVGDAPSSGQGFESAVAYAVAGALGYDRDHVTWTQVDRKQAAAGTVGGFDLDLDQFTAPDAGTKTADYSTGYFPVTDTLVIRQGDGPQPASVSALSGLTLAAPAGSSSAAAVQRVTGSAAQTYAGAADTLAALAAGSVSGAVLPIQSAIAVSAANPGLTLVGQLPSDPEIQPDQFKVLLPAESDLTGCVSAAIDKLRVEGTLDALAEQWVTPVAPKLN
jgi:polar amino acid transport system substrate-binding protein